MTDDQDLLDILRAEGSRGKRKPLDVVSMEELRGARALCRELLRPETTEQDFRRIIADFGLQPGTERFDAALRAWRGLRRS